MYFYRGEAPNFGDELNVWLMPKVFPDFFDGDDREVFLGIGSVIFDSHPLDAKKIVFGSGFGGYTKLPRLDESWKISCVRGPLTAKALRIDESFVAGDAAILTNRFRVSPRDRPGLISFMPHFQSLYRGHWRLACRLAGIHFIDPRSSVETILDEIQGSRLMISEAMHGAVVSDALRVPWVPILPFDRAHWMKWQDWAGALDLRLAQHRLAPSSVREAYFAVRARERHGLKDPRGLAKVAIGGLDGVFIGAAAATLRWAAMQEPTLSSDVSLDRALDRLQSKAEQILGCDRRRRAARKTEPTEFC